MVGLKPDFKKAYAIANDVLLMSHTIVTLPADIHGHIKNETEIKLCSYETAMRKYGFDVSFFGSEDALITEMGGRYILFYKKMIDQHRMKWSIGHESGHYYLGHNLDFKSLSKEQYRIQEIEADFFAAQILMPDQVIWELVNRGETPNRDNLIRWFDISAKAADGNSWNVKIMKDGSQLWARHRNGTINEGGKNKTPRPWDKQTGLNRNPKKRKNKKGGKK